MPFVAVVGAGPLGGAIAQTLALRNRVQEVRLIDSHASVAQGKALDILQSAPVERFTTNLTAAQTVHSAAGAGTTFTITMPAIETEKAGDELLQAT